MKHLSLLIGIAFLLIFTPIKPAKSYAEPYHSDPAAYILSKFKTHDIVFLGVRHKQPPIENFISGLIPSLHKAGVSHVCLEIPSDQQRNLDHYMQTGLGLTDIQLWPQIDSPEYRRILLTLHGASLVPVAIDLPESKFNKGISRDEYMAQMIAGIYEDHPDKKILVILGNRHVLKKLDWEDHVPSQGKTFYQDLTERCPGIKMFCIGQVIGQKPEGCDFTKAYSGIEGIVAMDVTGEHAGWKLGMLSVMAVKDMAVWDVLDGVVVW